MKQLIAIAALSLSACNSPVVVKDRPQIVSKPVTVPCVSGKRPDAVPSLKQQHPDWYSYTPKQKTEYAAAQGLRHQSYGQEVNAATGACQ